MSAIALANAQVRADGPHPMIPEAVRQCTPADQQGAQNDAGGAAQGAMSTAVPDGRAATGMDRLSGMLAGSQAGAPPAQSRPATGLPVPPDPVPPDLPTDCP